MLDAEGLRIIVKKMKGPKIVLAKVIKLDPKDARRHSPEER